MTDDLKFWAWIGKKYPIRIILNSGLVVLSIIGFVFSLIAIWINFAWIQATIVIICLDRIRDNIYIKWITKKYKEYKNR